MADRKIVFIYTSLKCTSNAEVKQFVLRKYEQSCCCKICTWVQYRYSIKKFLVTKICQIMKKCKAQSAFNDFSYIFAG